MNDDTTLSLNETEGINIYREGALHAALKAWYSRTGDRFEVAVGGYVVDIVRDTLLIEIQTCNFSALRRKLKQLLKHHPVRVVFPIAKVKWIVKLNAQGVAYERRKSPKRGHWAHAASELVYIHHLIPDPNFGLEVLMIEAEEFRRHDVRGSWRRRRWRTIDRRLLGVSEQVVFHSLADYGRFLPEALPQRFTTADLSDVLRQNRRVAQQVAYSMCKIGLIEKVGKLGRSSVYVRADT